MHVHQELDDVCTTRQQGVLWSLLPSCTKVQAMISQNTFTCGVVEKDGVPCMHVMAFVKSKLIPHLTPTNVMSQCWSTTVWQK